MTTESTALAPVARAQQALKTADREDKLRALVLESTDLVEVRDTVSRAQVHGAYMKLRNTRIEIEKAAKDAREDAQVFSKAVISEEKRLLTISSPEEERLKKLRDDWDEAAEREAQAKAEAARLRILAIQARIESIKGLPYTLVGKPVADITAARQTLAALPTSNFDELVEEAKAVTSATLAKLDAMVQEAEAREVEAKRQAQEAARIKAEGEALARRKAEQEEAERAARVRIEEQERASRARIEEEERKARIAREAAEAEERAARQRSEDEERVRRAAADEEQRRKDAAARAQREATEAEERRQREAQEAAARQQREEQAAREEGERRERIAAEERKHAADLRLRDAAPALLAALINITDQLERVGDSRKDAPFIEDARAAIALATGEEVTA